MTRPPPTSPRRSERLVRWHGHPARAGVRGCCAMRGVFDPPRRSHGRDAHATLGDRALINATFTLYPPFVVVRIVSPPAAAGGLDAEGVAGVEAEAGLAGEGFGGAVGAG